MERLIGNKAFLESLEFKFISSQLLLINQNYKLLKTVLKSIKGSKINVEINSNLFQELLKTQDPSVVLKILQEKIIFSDHLPSHAASTISKYMNESKTSTGKFYSI